MFIYFYSLLSTGVSNLDLSVLELYNYHKLYELRRTPDELESIGAHIHSGKRSEGTLDEPNDFSTNSPPFPGLKIDYRAFSSSKTQ